MYENGKAYLSINESLYALDDLEIVVDHPSDVPSSSPSPGFSVPPGFSTSSGFSVPSGFSTSSLRFSKHALGRLSDRNIELNTEQLERLNDGARKAGQKGIRDSLVIVDQLAFIVNVPNQTVGC